MSRILLNLVAKSGVSKSFDELERYQIELGVRKDYLLAKYPNAQEYLIYHALLGSSPKPSRQAQLITEDFPGDDSVEKFINYLADKYK